MERDEEVRLIDAARTDPQAFGAIFDAYYPRILRYLLRRVQDVTLAQELASNTFFAALQYLYRFTWRREAGFSSWLYAIATNEVRQHFRRKHRRGELSLEAMLEAGVEFADPSDLQNELSDAEEKIERQESAAQLRSILRSQPMKYQEVLVLRYFEECSIEEIANILNKRIGTVKSLLSRGTTMLGHSFERIQNLQPVTTLRIISPDTL